LRAGDMMMQSKSQDLVQVARAFLAYVRQHGQDGNWVRGIEAFSHAASECRDLEWVKHTVEKPKARIAISAEIERLMTGEFADIEKEKHGVARNAPVYFRVRQR
jgi:hypothetical protein